MPTHSAVHHSIETIKRSQGQSATARIAYITRSQITDERTGVRSSYKDAENELRSVELVGFSGTPSEFANALEAAEKRKDAQVGRSSILALPNELPLPAAASAVKRLQEALQERYGVASISAIHDAEGNRHAHIVESRRDSAGRSVDVLSKKTTAAAEMEWRRQAWSEIINEQLREHTPQSVPVDPRSLKRRAADGDEIATHQVQMPHLGPAKHAKNKTGSLRLKFLVHQAYTYDNLQLKRAQTALDAAFKEFAAQRTPYLTPTTSTAERGRLAAREAHQRKQAKTEQKSQNIKGRDGPSL